MIIPSKKTILNPFKKVLHQQEKGTVLHTSRNTETSLDGTIDSSKNQWHQLIVLGNGFDLECGLRSKFADFAYDRISKFPPLKFLKDFSQIIKDNNLTIWDLILYEERKKLLRTAKLLVRHRIYH